VKNGRPGARSSRTGEGVRPSSLPVLGPRLTAGCPHGVTHTGSRAANMPDGYGSFLAHQRCLTWDCVRMRIVRYMPNPFRQIQSRSKVAWPQLLPSLSGRFQT